MGAEDEMIHSNQQPNSTEALYSDEAVSKKRNIIMDLIGAIIDAGKNSNPELWKLHIDGALDRLDTEVYEPTLAKYYLPRKELEAQLLGEGAPRHNLSGPAKGGLSEYTAGFNKSHHMWRQHIHNVLKG